jgi:nucleoside-diphosphate kinase
MPDQPRYGSIPYPGGSLRESLATLIVTISVRLLSGRFGRFRLWRIVVTERTLVLIKPDAVQRGLIGEILGRLERKGLAIDAMRLRTMEVALADQHYAEHVDKAFYPPLKAFMTSGPLVALVLSGDEVIEVVRAMLGATDGRKAAAGTIRGDLSLSNRENLVHASDSPESAKREIALWFPDLG